MSILMIAALAADFTLYNIVPFSPGREAEAAANAREYRDRTGGDLVLYSLTLHPEGKPAMEKAERYIASYRALRREMEGSGMRLGILVQAILGHWPRVDRDVEDWTRTVNIKGEKVRFCPDDPGFAKYIEDVFALIAAERPAFVMLDDDVRAYSHEAECFCPRHVAEFNARRGSNHSEKALRERVAKARQGDEDYKTFLALQRDMMERLARRIRATLDASDPSIPAGICVATEETFLSAPLAKAVAAMGQTPVMRVSTGCYNERYASRLAANVTRKLGFAEYYRGSGIDILDESDTYPQNLWSKSAMSFFTHMEVAAFLGYKGAKVWYVNGRKMGSGPVSRAYTDVLAENRGILDALAGATSSSIRMDGVAIPCFTRFPRWHLANNHREMFLDADDLVGKMLVPFGIPFRAERNFSRDGVYVLASRAEVERMTDAELEAVFSHKVLVLGGAAVAVTARGRRDLLGLSARTEKFSFNFERVRATGEGLSASPSDRIPFFSGLVEGAEVLSDLAFRPYAGSPVFEVVAPGAVACRNALGGRVVTTAFHCGMNSLGQMSEGRKRYVVALLDQLNGAPIPFVCGNDQDVMVLVRPCDGEKTLVLAVNLNSEPIRSLRLRSAGAAAVSALLPGGEWRPARFRREGEWVVVDVPLAFCEAKAFMLHDRKADCVPACASQGNGELWRDTAGHVVNAHGGGVLPYGGKYYLYGEHKVYGRAGNKAHVGVHMYSSDDLLEWKDEGVALAVENEPGHDIEDGCILERPKVLFCEKTGKFVMFFHLELKGKRYSSARTGIAVAESPTGPYRFLRSLRPNDGQMSRDMTLFKDDDGKAYQFYASEDNATLHVAELTENYLDYTGRWWRMAEKDFTEAPAVCKKDGWYYLVGSGCTGWRPNEARYYRSRAIAGPWERVGNPCRGVNPANGLGPELTWGGQSNYMFKTPEGRHFVMFDIWRPDNQVDSRLVMLPAIFENGNEMRIDWRD